MTPSSSLSFLFRFLCDVEHTKILELINWNYFYLLVEMNMNLTGTETNANGCVPFTLLFSALACFALVFGKEILHIFTNSKHLHKFSNCIHCIDTAWTLILTNHCGGYLLARDVGCRQHCSGVYQLNMQMLDGQGNWDYRLTCSKTVCD